MPEPKMDSFKARFNAMQTFRRAAAACEVGAFLSPDILVEVGQALGTLAGMHVIPGATLELSEKLEKAFSDACRAAER